MSIIAIKSVTKFATSDGQEFTDRAAAVAHESYLTRLNALKAVGIQVPSELITSSEDLDLAPSAPDYIELDSDNLETIIARNADAILAALSVKKPGGRKAKTATEAVAA